MIGFGKVIGRDYIGLNMQIVFDVPAQGPKDVRAVLAAITARFL